MKLCRTCNTEKDISKFGNRAASPDGLSPRCKECSKAYDNSRLRDPKRMEARRVYQKTGKGKIAHAKAAKKWVENNLIKRSAHSLVSSAIRSDRLVKAESCETCGSNSSLNGHHDDYALPLVVRWLCDVCHKQWHIDNGEGKNAI